MRASGSDLEKLEQFEAAHQLAVGIEVPLSLQQELEQVIPAIDEIKEDARIASVHYNQDQTATFTLKTTPDLQFRISPPRPNSSLGCDEFRLTQRYENMVYAQKICSDEHYDCLFVPPTKPLYLKVGELRRSMLVEKVIQKDPHPDGNTLNTAVRQMVQFLLKTGGAGVLDPLPFVPTGGRLALQNLYHLTEEPSSSLPVRDDLEVDSIIKDRDSLLASLDDATLIDVALDELRTRRPFDLVYKNTYFHEAAVQVRKNRIETAKRERLEKILNPIQVAVPLEPSPPSNLLGISPQDLSLDLNLTDYAIIGYDTGSHSDGISRVITLGEVAQAIIDCINRKIQANPTNNVIELTPADMLIGKKSPRFSSDLHYHYTTLQGLGYRDWPDSKEPPYWIELVLQSIKNKGLITSFKKFSHSNPQLHINLELLQPSPSQI
jgi:hypothetical protein